MASVLCAEKESNTMSFCLVLRIVSKYFLSTKSFQQLHQKKNPFVEHLQVSDTPDFYQILILIFTSLQIISLFFGSYIVYMHCKKNYNKNPIYRS